MAATWSIFQTDLETIFKLKQSKDFSDFSDKFTSAFSNSTLNLASTTFGQQLTYANYDTIKNAMKLFLDFNKNIETNLQKIKISLKNLTEFTNEIKVSEIKTVTSNGEEIKYKVIVPKKLKNNEDKNSSEIIDLPTGIHPFLKTLISPLIRELNKNLNEIDIDDKDSLVQLNKSIQKLQNFVNNIDFGMIPYLFLETSFILFWTTAKFSPLPPIPPTLSPLFGTLVLIPGIPGVLSLGFKSAFTSKDPSTAAKIITTSLQTHASTISGTYSGLIASPTGLIPSPPIPWVGVV